MSAPAPTTFSLAQARLPPELLDEVMGDMDGLDLLQESLKDPLARRKVQQYYLSQYPKTAGLIATYDASQPEDTVFAVPRSKSYLQARSTSLAEKTNRLVGGAGLVERAVGQSSDLYHVAQAAMAAGRWNSKVIGLIPLLKKIPTARDCLSLVAETPSDSEKFVIMKNWIKTHPDDVRRLSAAEIIRCRAEDVGAFVKPIFYALQGKVYNLVPREIKFFTGLQKLSFYNNFLSEVPAEIATLPLLELNLGANFLKKMPPAIPTLRRLNIAQNREQLRFEDIAGFIREYIEKGGEYIEITLDRSDDPRFQELIGIIASSGTHTLKVDQKDGQSVFTVERVLEATQPLEEG